MRSSVLALLLLGTAVPALADPDTDPSREQRIEERAAAREARSEARAERSEAPPRQERPEPRFERADAPPPPPREERPAPRFEQAAPPPAQQPAWRERESDAPALERPNVPPSRGQAEAPPGERRREWASPDQPRAPQARPADSVESWRWEEREAARRERRGDREQLPPPPPVVRNDTMTPPVVAPRPGDRVTSTDRRQADILRDRIAAEGWRQDWRRDRRYDWKRYRDYDRRRFRVGIYIDPFGWDYRNWNLGWTLPSRFYSSRYWIEDPWYYRLPPAYGPYRWIRYYDDVLLVDLRSGRVVDRIRNFFW